MTRHELDVLESLNRDVAPYTMGPQIPPSENVIVRTVRLLTLFGGWTRRSVIYNRLGNVSAVDLSSALMSMYRRGVVEFRVIHTTTKPAEEWRLR